MEKKEELKLALLGYGKMGKSLEKLSTSAGFVIHTIVRSKEELLSKKNELSECDAAIEFTNPVSAFNNVKFCLENNIPVVSGTTAWNDQLEEANELSRKLDVSFFHAHNFSLAVHHFFKLNKMLAKGLNGLEYNIEIEEIHHTEKLDAPSGTAIAAARILIEEQDKYEAWSSENPKEGSITIKSKRLADVKGTHIVTFTSPIDEISISHKAFTRDGFAEGALLAARFIYNNKGCFTMDDLLDNLSNS